MEGLQDISADADKGRMKISRRSSVVSRQSRTKKCAFRIAQCESNKCAFRVSRFAFCGSHFALFALLFSLFTFHLSPSSFAADWKQAVGGRAWSFPGDHGSHPEYRTEWWYFTGNLADEAGNRYGYQLTFFRQGINNAEAGNSKLRKDNLWAVRDVYLAHFALTDFGKNRFRHADRTSRTGPGLAHANPKGMNVRVLDWSAHMKKGVIYLNARHKGMEIKLTLNPGKPLVLHGHNGLSRKGPAEGQSSYYYSFTDLKTNGSIKTPLNSEPVNVRGVSWFDQEFGSNQLTSEQVGWDWFGIHLSDGRDLMVYFIRKKDGSIEAASSGTLVERKGSSGHLKLSDTQVYVLEKWKSPETGGIYPGKWRMCIPSAGIDITIAPPVANQELITGASTGITYWEGAVEGKGTSGNKPVTVEGYAELTGYTGSLGGAF